MGNPVLTQLEMNFQSGFKKNSYQNKVKLIFSIVSALWKRKGGGESSQTPLIEADVSQEPMPGASLLLTFSGNTHLAPTEIDHKKPSDLPKRHIRQEMQ